MSNPRRISSPSNASPPPPRPASPYSSHFPSLPSPRASRPLSSLLTPNESLLGGSSSGGRPPSRLDSVAHGRQECGSRVAPKGTPRGWGVPGAPACRRCGGSSTMLSLAWHTRVSSSTHVGNFPRGTGCRPFLRARPSSEWKLSVPSGGRGLVLGTRSALGGGAPGGASRCTGGGARELGPRGGRFCRVPARVTAHAAVALPCCSTCRGACSGHNAPHVSQIYMVPRGEVGPSGTMGPWNPKPRLDGRREAGGREAGGLSDVTGSGWGMHGVLVGFIRSQFAERSPGPPGSGADICK